MSATIILQRVVSGSTAAMQRQHAPVQVVEEGEQVEAELHEALLLVPAQRPEDLRGVEHVVLVHDSAGTRQRTERVSVADRRTCLR
jgi:2-C-methyl-D-erythritol 4-phosphate cytidylyltransferase